MVDHDRLHKELIRAFFMPFLWALLPDVAAYVDPDSIEFMDKEIFTDISGGRKHIADLVVKVKFLGEETFFIIHIEHESKSRAEFPAVMFDYFSRLHERYRLPIYPIVLLSYDSPKRPAVSSYKLSLAGKTVLKFSYRAIQLNRLSWRRFLKEPNPAATALMAKMNIAPKDRARVRLQCMRMLATMKLDPAKSELIGIYVETYLKLTADEMKQYERAAQRLPLEEKQATMEMMTSWHTEGWKLGRQEGRQEGVHEGKEELLAAMLEQRFSTLPDNITGRLDHLSSEQLTELGKALFDFASFSDLEAWLAQR
jgi:hypothetical protein